MIYAALIILLFLLAIAALLMILRQARRIQRLERQVKTQGQELDRAFNRSGRLNERVSELEGAEEKRKKHEEELAEAEAQIQKAQKIEKLWQSGMQDIQAYDYDAARKAVTGNAGE